MHLYAIACAVAIAAFVAVGREQVTRSLTATSASSSATWASHPILHASGLRVCLLPTARCRFSSELASSFSAAGAAWEPAPALLGSACSACPSCDLRKNATHRLALALPEGCRKGDVHAEISSVGFNTSAGSRLETVRHTLTAALGGGGCAAVQLVHEEAQRGAEAPARGYALVGGVEACSSTASTPLREDAVHIDFAVQPFRHVAVLESTWTPLQLFSNVVSILGLIGCAQFLATALWRFCQR